MSNHLHPFQPFSDDVQVTGDIQIHEGKIVVQFHWTDRLNTIAAQKGSEVEISRQNDLWKHTCFEAFLHAEHKENYFEINLAPSGAWNAYEFQTYRQPQPPHETEKLVLLSFHREAHKEEHLIEAQFQSKETDHVWWCSLTAVIELVSGKKHYFAVEHKGDRPDFHLKESFKLRRVAT